MIPSLIAGTLGLLVLTALLSAAEGALLSLTRVDRDILKHTQNRAARALRSLLESPREFVFTLEVASEMAMVAFTLCLTVLLIETYDLAKGWLSIAIGPPILLIICQLVPRALAARHPRPVAQVLAIPLQAMYYLLLPITWPLKRLSEWLMDILGIPATGGHRLEESEFKTLVDIGEKEGTLREAERELIHNVFELGDRRISELMTPRTEVVGFDISTPVDRILEGIKDQRFARVPIFKTNLDNILGILYTKDLLALRAGQGGSRRTLSEMLHQVYFVPVTKKADDLFREFQIQKTHMAVVVDEYGGVAGVVTMDDLLAELFGVMLDEHDIEELEFIRLATDRWRVHGTLDLEQFCEMLEVDPPDEELEVSTVGGFVLSLFGTLPREGETMRFGRLEFTVAKVNGTRIHELVVHRHPPETPVDSEHEEGT